MRKLLGSALLFGVILFCTQDVFACAGCGCSVKKEKPEKKEEPKDGDDAEKETPKLCHKDLTAGNLLYQQEQLIAIDWEYAAMGSRYFDIAIAMAPLPCDAQAALLETAFDSKPDSELLAAGTLIAEICTQLWQACFAATTPLDTVLWSHEDKVI